MNATASGASGSGVSRVPPVAQPSRKACDWIGAR